MADGESKASRGGIQVIARAAAVLRTLKAAQSGMSLGQIAEKIALPRSTVQRIVGALQEERLVIASSTGGGIRLGPEIHSLGLAAQFNIADRCRPFMNKLSEVTGETVDLSVLRNGRMIFLDQVVGTQRLRTISSIGEVFPLTTTANGRSCLAQLPEDRALELAQAEWTLQGVKGNIDMLQNTLATIRETGIAFDEDEHTDGISAIGFAFIDMAGDIHSISVPVPTTRFHRIRNTVVSSISETRVEVLNLFEN